LASPAIQRKMLPNESGYRVTGLYDEYQGQDS
jgi:hypothetical protein